MTRKYINQKLKWREVERKMIEKIVYKKLKEVAKKHNFRDSKGKLIIPKIKWS